jgi:hypothetical protein
VEKPPPLVLAAPLVPPLVELALLDDATVAPLELLDPPVTAPVLVPPPLVAAVVPRVVELPGVVGVPPLLLAVALVAEFVDAPPLAEAAEVEEPAPVEAPPLTTPLAQPATVRETPSR